MKLATPAEAESRQPPTRVARRSGSRLSSVPLPSEAGQSSLKASLVSSALLSCSPASWGLSQLDGRCCDLKVSNPQAVVKEHSFLLRSFRCHYRA